MLPRRRQHEPQRELHPRLHGGRHYNLNRVASATVSQNTAPVKTFAYDATGNLLRKSDVGNYAYPLAGSALPHAAVGVGVIAGLCRGDSDC